MLRAAGRFLRAITTARDNETPSLLRIVALASSILFHVWAWAALIRGDPFDPVALSAGISTLVLAIGTALRIALPTNAGNDGWQTGAMTLPTKEQEIP